jgi:hypothetical protein
MEENGESDANEVNEEDASNFVEPNPEGVNENSSPPKKRSKRKAPLSQEGLTKTAADVLSPR